MAETPWTPTYQIGSVEYYRDAAWRTQEWANQQTATGRVWTDGYLNDVNQFNSKAQMMAAAALTAEANPINQGAFVQSWTMQRMGKLESRISALEARVTS